MVAGVNAIARVPDQSVLITGFFKPTLHPDGDDIHNNLITSTATEDVFVYRISNDGDIMWSMGLWLTMKDADLDPTDSALALGSGIAYANDSAYVTGTYRRSIPAFGTNSDTQGVFVMRMGLDDGTIGNVVKATTALDDVSYSFGSGVVVDGAGGVLVVGEFIGNYTFGETQLTTGGAGRDWLSRADAFVWRVPYV